MKKCQPGTLHARARLHTHLPFRLLRFVPASSRVPVVGRRRGRQEGFFARRVDRIASLEESLDKSTHSTHHSPASPPPPPGLSESCWFYFHSTWTLHTAGTKEVEGCIICVCVCTADALLPSCLPVLFISERGDEAARDADESLIDEVRRDPWSSWDADHHHHHHHQQHVLWRLLNCQGGVSRGQGGDTTERSAERRKNNLKGKFDDVKAVNLTCHVNA